MDIDLINQMLDVLGADFVKLKQEINKTDQVVTAGENLQSYLDKGGTIKLEPGAAFEAQGFELNYGTRLIGNGAHLHGQIYPALYSAQNEIIVEDLILTSGNLNVVQFGLNSAALQATPALVPKNINLIGCTIPTHRGQDGIEVNAECSLVNCKVSDLYSPVSQESHCVVFLNTTGNCLISGGDYNGGSIGIFSGGDTLKVQGVRRSNLIIEDLVIAKPVEWKTDGINRNIKNSLELKDGHNVIIRNVRIFNSWGPIQRGYGLMFTPAVGGSIVNVLVERMVMAGVGAGINITGRELNVIDPIRTTGIVIKNSKFNIQHDPLIGEPGFFLLLTRGPDVVTIENNDIQTTSDYLFVVGDRARVGKLIIRGNKIKSTKYILKVPTGNNGSFWNGKEGEEGGIDELVIEGNEFFGEVPSIFKTTFPNNTWS